MYYLSSIRIKSANCVILLAAALFAVASLPAQAARSTLLQEDFPFQGACISANFPAKNVALKGLAIRVGNNGNMLFDTELLRMAAGWTGGYISIHGVAFDGGHGAHPKIEGDQKFGTRQAPGWADEHGSFVDPRHEPFGPLPVDWCRYDGLSVAGMDVVLSYTVLGTKIHEQPSSVAREKRLGFVRTFEIAKAKADLATVIAEVENGAAIVSGLTATLKAGSEVTCI